MANNVIQKITKQLTTEPAITGDFPNDGTIPQSSEGTSLMTQAITPASASNKIRVIAHVCGATSTATVPRLFIFSDQQTDSYGGQFGERNTGAFRAGCFAVCEFVAGTTSAITIDLRAGVGAGTWTVNSSGSATFGGVVTSVLTVEEIEV